MSCFIAFKNWGRSFFRTINRRNAQNRNLCRSYELLQFSILIIDIFNFNSIQFSNELTEHTGLNNTFQYYYIRISEYQPGRAIFVENTPFQNSRPRVLIPVLIIARHNCPTSRRYEFHSPRVFRSGPSLFDGGSI